ncbi:hypothetical protein EJ02DRAFT_460506 [Clathrospora elynae]|uniref:Uncharacterized protein n=1 Tax=Clathrospora elynae TaxID=706981 RepID=A0A6A5S5U3_9PLEO|nr:hypothetical protein EJ02DRAFT_460506 [Clathrospora elynae]
MFSKTIITLLGLVALGAAVPTTLTTRNPEVQFIIYREDSCAGAGSPATVSKGTCWDLPDDIKSLRVIRHVAGLRYNALNVYSARNCNSGPVLQPLTTGCSAVVAYQSIELSVAN